ncbi:hypothetical protein D4764_02G0000130 [Takifugu flavidus]|uniref:Uncharacterized protein n=1 Tax=Takifugu flavidus TaxID=433684 RepID=A0A5C6NHB0_9TELE|nr:hypothetical protein D4764_02G0000130 [Takifugu flavidus]
MSGFLSSERPGCYERLQQSRKHQWSLLLPESDQEPEVWAVELDGTIQTLGDPPTGAGSELELGSRHWAGPQNQPEDSSASHRKQPRPGGETFLSSDTSSRTLDVPRQLNNMVSLVGPGPPDWQDVPGTPPQSMMLQRRVSQASQQHRERSGFRLVDGQAHLRVPSLRFLRYLSPASGAQQVSTDQQDSFVSIPNFWSPPPGSGIAARRPWATVPNYHDDNRGREHGPVYLSIS